MPFAFFFYYSATNVLLFSLMHFLVKPLKSWAMIDYDEMVSFLRGLNSSCKKTPLSLIIQIQGGGAGEGRGKEGRWG